MNAISAENVNMHKTHVPTYGDFPKIGVPFLGGPHNKDYSILDSMSGSLFWETTISRNTPRRGYGVCF